jgi:hypothetical protein
MCVFNTWFLCQPEIADFGGLCGLGGPKNHPKRWGGGSPHSGMVLGAAGAAQTQQIDEIRPAQNTAQTNKPYEFIWFGAMDVTKPYEFIGFGTMDVTKPYES